MDIHVTDSMQLWPGLYWMRRLETKLKQYPHAYERGMLENLAAAEHVLETHQPIKW